MAVSTKGMGKMDYNIPVNISSTYDSIEDQLLEGSSAWRMHKVFTALRKVLNENGFHYPCTFPDWWARLASKDDAVATQAIDEFEAIYKARRKYPRVITQLNPVELRKQLKSGSPNQLPYKYLDALFKYPDNLVDQKGRKLPFVRLMHMPTLRKDQIPRQENNLEQPILAKHELKKLMYTLRATHPVEYVHHPNNHHKSGAHLQPVPGQTGVDKRIRDVMPDCLAPVGRKKDVFGCGDCDLYCYVASAFCLYDNRIDYPSGKFGFTTLINQTYLEEKWGPEKYSFAGLCLLASQIGKPSQVHSIERVQWGYVKGLENADRIKTALPNDPFHLPLNDMLDAMNARRIPERGELEDEDSDFDEDLYA